MKRKIALILAMLTVCSFASCGSDANDDDEPFTLNSSKSSSEDADEDESENDEEELSKLESEAEEARKLAEEQQKKEEELKKQEEQKEQEELKKKAEEEQKKLEEEQKKKAAEEQKKLEEEQKKKAEEEQKKLEEEQKALESEVSDELSKIEESQNKEGSENEDGAFALGTINDNVYSSDFSGVTFNLPDNMTFADEEEIMSIMDISKDILGDKTAALMEISKKVTIYDMLARDVVSGDNIQVMYENLGRYGDSVAKAYDVDKYLEAVTKQFSALESSGIKVTEKGRTDIKLGDQDFTKVELETYYETYDFTTTQAYYIKKIDDYMLSIIITLGVDSSVDGLETYEKMFS